MLTTSEKPTGIRRSIIMRHVNLAFGRIIGAGIAGLLLGWPLASSAATFFDSTRVNVLRQYDVPGNLLVAEAIANNTGGAIVDSAGGNDGSGTPDQWQFNPNDGTQNGTATFTLPGTRLVGSFRADFNGAHVPQGGFVLEGLTTSGWTTLANVPTVAGAITGTFTPQNVSALRYTVTGPGTGPRFAQNAELQVFLASGQTVPYDSGYNLLRDAGKVVGTTDSVTSGPWSARTSVLGGTATVDGNYFSGHIHGATGRTFFTLSLNAPTFINRGHLGWYHGQTWANYSRRGHRLSFSEGWPSEGNSV
jgi:hypothetical protein